MKRMKAISAILLAFCMMILFVGCSRTSKSYSAREYGYYAEPAEMEYDIAGMEAPMAMDEGYSANAKAAGKVSTTASAKVSNDSENTNLTGAVAGRKIIKNGDLTIQTRNSTNSWRI